MKTLEGEQYVVIKAYYKFTVFEIWRDFNVLLHWKKALLVR